MGGPCYDPTPPMSPDDTEALAKARAAWPQIELEPRLFLEHLARFEAVDDERALHE